MMSALAALSLFLVISSGLSFPEKDGKAVEPEYLDHLLATEQYERFAEIMNIPDVSLVRPKEGERNEYPMQNKDLELGDIVPVSGPLKEESRQGIRHDRYPGSRWQNGYIPFEVSNDYTKSEKDTIYGAINAWNNRVRCLKLRPRNGEEDYVFVFPGNGCWSYLGRIGGRQGLSLQKNGCVWRGTTQHEFQHAAGFAHEHNRLDRDNSVEVLWDNIPNEWKSQYEITDSRAFGLQQSYDYYSNMHYPMKAPGTNRDAFRIKANGIDESRIGRGNDMTDTDIRKLNQLYC